MSNTSKKLRVLVDSTSAKAGAKEVTAAMGKVVTSGKTTISTFKDLNTVLGQTGTQFSKLKQMQKSYNPFSSLEKSIESYTKQMTKATTQGQTFTVKLKEGNATVTQSLKDTETQTKKTTNQFIKLKDVTEAPFSQASKDIASLSKAIEKLNNTMVAEAARTKAINTELGKKSVKVQEQRRLTEELLRSKTRLNATYSDEYVQLVKTRKAIEDRNKEIRTMGVNVDTSRKSVNNLNSSFSLLGTTLAGLSLYFSTTGLVRQADAYTNLTNKLAAVTQGTVDVTDASRDLLGMSIENRSSLEGTMDIYTKMIRINENLGKSQQEVTNLTEAVSKAVAMSGASAQGAQGAIMQFGQAMASNFATSAQELNSILEQTPSLAYYMVKGINQVDESVNLTTATLKRFAEDGGLSSELVFEAFQRVLPQIREDFASTSQTVESATQNLTDSFSVLVGELDESYGVTDSIVESMTELAAILPDLETEITALTVGVTSLVSMAALGGLAAIITAIGLPIVGVVAGLSTLAGVITYTALEMNDATKRYRESKDELDELTTSTDRYTQSLDVMTTVQLRNAQTDSRKQRLEEEIKYQDLLIEKETVLSKLSSSLAPRMKVESNKELVLLNKELEISSNKMSILDERLDNISTKKFISSLEDGTKSVKDFNKYVSSMDTGLTKAEKAERSYNDQLSNLDKAYESAKKGIVDKNQLMQLEAAYVDGTSKAYEQYLETLKKIEASQKKEDSGTNFLISYSSMQQEIDALKEGKDAYKAYQEDVEITTEVLQTLGDQATPLQIEALYSKMKELKDAQKDYNKALADQLTLKKEEKKLDDVKSNYRDLKEEVYALEQGKKVYEDLLLTRRALELLDTDIITPENVELIEKIKEDLSFVDDELELLGKDSANSWSEDIVNSLSEAITTEDWDSVFSVLTNSISNAVSEGLSTSTASFLGAGSSAFGAFGGALVGAAASSLFSSYESVGSSEHINISSGQTSGYTKEKFEKSGLFGGSKTVIESYTDEQIAQISNSVNSAQIGITSLIGSMGVALLTGIDDFSTSVSADDIDSALDEISEDFVYANVAYIESFMDANQTAIEALAEISEAWGALENAFDVLNVDSLESSIDDVVTTISSGLISAYEDELATFQELKDELTDSIANATIITDQDDTQWWQVESTSLFGSRGYGGRSELENYVQGFIDDVDDSIDEINSRIVSVYEEAYTTFVTDLEQAVATVNNVDLDSALDLFAEQITNYSENFYTESEQLQNAMEAAEEDLLDFADLGIDSTTSLSDFREAFEAFTSSDAFTAEGYAQWIAAASALTTFTEASEGLDDVFEDITDYVSELMGLSADGTQTLASARAEYEATLAAAQGGDEDAIDDLSTYADTYLEIAAANAATSADLALARAGVIADLTSLTGEVPEFATGGNHAGGWRVVGDGGNGSGTELEYTGSSQIFNGKQASTLIDVEGLRQELSEIRMILRSGVGTLAKNTNKSYKVLDRWDKVGLPQDRGF